MVYFPPDHTALAAKDRRQYWVIPQFHLSLYLPISAAEKALGWVPILYPVTGMELGACTPIAFAEAPFPQWGKGSSRRSKERERVILTTRRGLVQMLFTPTLCQICSRANILRV